MWETSARPGQMRVAKAEVFAIPRALKCPIWVLDGRQELPYNQTDRVRDAGRMLMVCMYQQTAA